MTTGQRWPDEVAHLEVCPVRQLPVPFITPWEDGRAAYTALDPVRKIQCIEERLCAMCGLTMGRWIAFICDITSLEPGGYTIEPPVHERCAELALGGLCPYLSRERVPRRPATGKDVFTCPPEAMEGIAKRPLVVAIVQNYRVGLVRAYGGGTAETLVYYPGRVERARVFEYADGRLAEVAS
jgi:hypothetical protein